MRSNHWLPGHCTQEGTKESKGRILLVPSDLFVCLFAFVQRGKNQKRRRATTQIPPVKVRSPPPPAIHAFAIPPLLVFTPQLQFERRKKKNDAASFIPDSEWKWDIWNWSDQIFRVLAQELREIRGMKWGPRCKKRSDAGANLGILLLFFSFHSYSPYNFDFF